MFKEFINHLRQIFVSAFAVLDEQYTIDVLTDLGLDLEAELQNFFEVRYLLIDGKTGQLESRRLYETLDEAVTASTDGTHGDTCLVAMLLAERS
jgi:hypothetical protein